MSKRILAAIGAALLLSLALAACGGDDDGGSSAEGPSSTAESTATTPEDPLEAYENMDLHPDLADGDFLGDAAAPVTLTLFEDFQCPFCLAFNLAFEQIIVEEYVAEGEVLLQFRHFPILGEESEAAAQAAICTAAQDVFWPFHNRLFLEQARAGQLENEELNVGRFSEANLRQFALDAGAGGAAYDACRDDPATLTRLQEDFTTARGLGLRGTPGVVIDGTPVQIPRDADELRAVLDEALER